MSIILQNYVQIVQGARVKPLPPLIEGGYTLIHGAGFDVRLSNIQIIVVVTTFVLMAAFFPGSCRTRGSAATCAPASRT